MSKKFRGQLVMKLITSKEHILHNYQGQKETYTRFWVPARWAKKCTLMHPFSEWNPDT